MIRRKGLSFRKKLLIVSVLFILLVLLIASFFGKRGIIEIYQAREERDVLIKEIDRLKEEKAKIEREIEELKNNPEAIEEKAREKLWMMKPDEMVVVKEKKERPNSSESNKKK